MKFKNEFEGSYRKRDRPHSHSRTPYLGLDPYNGVAIQCQFCSGQSFRRSTLRSDDIGQILLMRYPVRCADCGRRQLASFAVAAASLPKMKKRIHRPGQESKDSGSHRVVS